MTTTSMRIRAEGRLLVEAFIGRLSLPVAIRVVN
jgi:hypothetical protein